MHIFNRDYRIEKQARRISDPLDRLRYLRNAKPSFLRRKWPPWMAAVALICAGLLTMSQWSRSGAKSLPAGSTSYRVQAASIPAPSAGTFTHVWSIESTPAAEMFSNGLRIENARAVSNVPRGRFRVFPRATPDLMHAQWRDQPVGIVYHTTESPLAPFQPSETNHLQKISEGVLDGVRQNRSYHFVIDRFARVHRIVGENDVAHHAGASVWGDSSNVFVGLNRAFLGIAIETQTHPGEDLPTATQAQVEAVKKLTDMLRSRYPIDAVNCVTHAQVSVNPVNMLIGYHSDWADRFPFQELGLGNNYAIPPAAISAFGFGYDPWYLQSTGARLMPGLRLADAQLTVGAARAKLAETQYRKQLQRNYREIESAASNDQPAQEKHDDQQH